MIYAGIGSRQTPSDILNMMFQIALDGARQGNILRSGHAPGADRAFEDGARTGVGKMEIYLPWASFEGGCEYVALEEPTPAAIEMAAEFHPGWVYLKPGARKLMARNCHQVLGRDLDTPAELIICWTPDGSLDGSSSKAGGTGQALRMASKFDIAVCNLAREDHRQSVWA